MSNRLATVICHEPPGHVDLRECPLNSLQQGQVLLETLYSAISPGTELRCLGGNVPDGGAGPYVPGYQSVGRIVSVGAESRRQVGEIVFNANATGYGDGLRALWGAHSSLLIASEANLVDLPAGINLSHAALAKLTAIALHGLKTARICAGERIAVIGLGPLGQLSSRLARLLGAEVVAFDKLESRVALASGFGLQAAVVEETVQSAASRCGWPEKEFDVIVDVTGVPRLINEFMLLARDPQPWAEPVSPGTRYVLQGSYAGSAQFDYMTAFYKEMSFIVPRDHYCQDIQESVNFIASGRLDLGSIIGEPVAPIEAGNIYHELAEPTSSRLTAVFDWSLLS